MKYFLLAFCSMIMLVSCNKLDQYSKTAAIKSGEINSLPSINATKTNDIWLFVTFKPPGDKGIWLSISTDGYHWQVLNNDNPWLVPDPRVGVMRDPFIARGPAGDFHMVWTCGNRKIGYAHSNDLIHWSPQRIIPVFTDNKNLLNVWAPEMAHDEKKDQWIIFWSSTIKGRFSETDGQVKNEKNHRIYSIKTKDFTVFSDPELFFDPGYPVIDATLYKRHDSVTMIFKDEREFPIVKKQLKVATAPDFYGPWSVNEIPFTEPWTEGPSIMKLSDQFIVYYDTYRRPQHMSAAITKDFKTWTDVTEKLRFPPKSKHGSFLKISQEEATALINFTKPK